MAQSFVQQRKSYTIIASRGFAPDSDEDHRGKPQEIGAVGRRVVERRRSGNVLQAFQRHHRHRR
jgi:hypothetical protein